MNVEYRSHFADGKTLPGYKADPWLGQSSRSPLPTPKPCQFLFHSALCLLNPFSKLDPSSSAPWDELFTCSVYKDGSRSRQARGCPPCRAVTCSFSRTLWEQCWEITSPVSLFSASLLSILAINSKYEPATDPVMSAFCAFL